MHYGDIIFETSCRSAGVILLGLPASVYRSQLVELRRAYNNRLNAWSNLTGEFAVFILSYSC